MINPVFRYFILFALLVMLQVLVLNNIHMSILINPYVYILFILLLPFQSPGWLVLSLAFSAGITMDSFSDTLGMHGAATVLMAFIREYLMKVIAPRDGYVAGQVPHYGNMGLLWFITYAGILTLIHHMALFLLEDFRWSYVFTALIKALLSGLLSLIIMMVLLLFTYKPR